MAATLKAIHPVLGARDVAAAVQWYAGRLGFSCIFDDGGGPIRCAGIRRDAAELHLQWQDDRHFPSPGDDAPAYCFLAGDPDALHAGCTRRRGLRPTLALRDAPWGTREFGVYDPNRHGLRFYKRLS